MLLACMFGLGMGEILMILVVALLFLGPDKLPEAAKSLSKGIRDFRRQTRELQDTIEADAEIGGAIRDLKSALRGDDRVWPPRAPATAKVTADPGVAAVISPAAAADPPAELAGSAEAPSAEPGAGAAYSTEAAVATGASSTPQPAATGDELPLIRPAGATVARSAGRPAAEAAESTTTGSDEPSSTGNAHG